VTDLSTKFKEEREAKAAMETGSHGGEEHEEKNKLDRTGKQKNTKVGEDNRSGEGEL
jgi:hypothetical protein